MPNASPPARAAVAKLGWIENTDASHIAQLAVDLVRCRPARFNLHCKCEHHDLAIVGASPLEKTFRDLTRVLRGARSDASVAFSGWYSDEDALLVTAAESRSSVSITMNRDRLALQERSENHEYFNAAIATSRVHR
jgi:hypothetical protein